MCQVPCKMNSNVKFLRDMHADYFWRLDYHTIAMAWHSIIPYTHISYYYPGFAFTPKNINVFLVPKSRHAYMWWWHGLKIGKSEEERKQWKHKTKYSTFLSLSSGLSHRYFIHKKDGKRNGNNTEKKPHISSHPHFPVGSDSHGIRQCSVLRSCWGFQ